jgi:hypothetical protein
MATLCGLSRPLSPTPCVPGRRWRGAGECASVDRTKGWIALAGHERALANSRYWARGLDRRMVGVLGRSGGVTAQNAGNVTAHLAPYVTLEPASTMATLGINEAFARYGAKLHNGQWSVTAWASDGSLVVSLWEHHHRKSAPKTLEFAARASRWTGPGNTEFRKNVQRAFESSANVRLVIVRTLETERVETGEDGSTIPKDFFLREDLVGKVVEWDRENYAFRFVKA